MSGCEYCAEQDAGFAEARRAVTAALIYCSSQ